MRPGSSRQLPRPATSAGPQTALEPRPATRRYASRQSWARGVPAGVGLPAAAYESASDGPADDRSLTHSRGVTG